MKDLRFYLQSIKLVAVIATERLWVDFIYSILVNLESVFWAVFFLRFMILNMEQYRSFSYFAVAMLFMCLFIFVIRMYRAWYENLYRRESDIKIQAKMKSDLFEKSYTVKRIYYDNPEFYESYCKAVEFADKVLFQTVDTVSGMVGTLFMCASVFTVLFTIDPFALLFLIFPLIGKVIFEKKLNSANHTYFELEIPQKRWKDYVTQIFFESKYASELRMTNIGLELKHAFFAAGGKNQSIITEMAPKRIYLYFMKELLINRIPFSIILMYIIYLVLIKRTIQPADVSVMLLGLVELSDTFGVFLSHFIQIQKYGNYAKNYFYFIDEKEYVEENTVDKRSALFQDKFEIENLSFGYSEEKQILKNVSLSIKKGQKIAVVGQNGAGKSTLMNLLLRLYTPDSGTITLDGISIENLDLESYRSLFACVFQDYKIFAMSLAENVALSEITEDEIAHINQALKMSKLEKKAKGLPAGIFSMLTREFDDEGIEFSGGEYQRLAIARAFRKDAPILILDEPTSAIDPIAEDELYRSILSLGRDKTVIYVLHRLSYAREADQIVFLKDGQIAELGTHEALMEKKGYYASLYIMQSHMYTDAAQEKTEQEGSY